jgi:FlaA1/EpsC-like NDP-sugar epimerase
VARRIGTVNCTLARVAYFLLAWCHVVPVNPGPRSLPESASSAEEQSQQPPAEEASHPRHARWTNLVKVGFSPVLSDLVLWLVATEWIAFARVNFESRGVSFGAVSILALCLAAGQVVFGALVLLYQGRYMPGSFDELRALAVSVTAVAVLGTVVVLALDPSGLPRSVPLLAWPLALVGMASIRYLKRVIHEAAARPKDAERILILGGGWVGSALALRMVRDPASPFHPVGFLDDDPGKRNLQLHGVRVCGGLSDLADVAGRLDVTRVVVAVKSADAALIRKVSDAAARADIGVLVLPPLSEQLSGSQLKLSSLRDVDVEDVIGRRPVDTDITSIAAYITGRRVLVTGAGGSIGSELCRQLQAFGPAELVMLDRDESALHAVELSIHGRALLESSELALVDIRDTDSLHTVFLEHEPQVVFHAAALKHLTLLERYPREALKSNVIGTLNVLEAAAKVGVEHFVNISTDKAANPTSALGHSKRLAERLTSWFSECTPNGKYLSVRFGNVLGSRGSVLHAFTAQIEGGGPVTVTDPEVTRFFMTIPEACQLVIQAGAIGRGGEALVLDMGERVNIADMARRMIAMSGKAVDIVFTGLRDGEKMHEDLLGDGEHGERPLHHMISHVMVPSLDPHDLDTQPWIRAATGSVTIGSPVRYVDSVIGR